MDIVDLLKDIPDKFEHRKTTSHLFKTDVFNFFNKKEFSDKVCVEIGCHIGYTTKILSYIFKEVYAFNLLNTIRAQEFTKDRNNITYFAQDVYTTEMPIDYGDVFLIDAVHTYGAVINDTLRSLEFKSSGKKYFIYDDYGIEPNIQRAINSLVEKNKIKIVKHIGHSKEDSFIKPLTDHEGVICVEV